MLNSPNNVLTSYNRSPLACYSIGHDFFCSVLRSFVVGTYSALSHCEYIMKLVYCFKTLGIVYYLHLLVLKYALPCIMLTIL